MAPVILQTKNLKVVIYPKDHDPPHVHVLGPNGEEAKFRIKDLECYYARGMKAHTLTHIRDFLKGSLAVLLEAWNENQK